MPAVGPPERGAGQDAVARRVENAAWYEIELDRFPGEMARDMMPVDQGA